MPSRTAVLVLFLTGAAFTDAREGKIYNYWLLPAYAAGVFWYFSIAKGTDFLVHCFVFPFLLFFISIPLRYIGGLAAGDSKLLLALSIWFSYREFFVCTYVSLVIGAAVGVGYVLTDFIYHRKRCGAYTVRFAFPVFISFLLHIGGVF